MKQALVFPSEEALWAALTSKLVPETVQAKAALWTRTADGGFAVCPSVSLSRADRAELIAAGVTTSRVDEASLQAAICWPALLPPRPGAVGEATLRSALLVADTTTSLLEIAGELVRLGCERASYQLIDGGRALVRVHDPPYYTLAGEGAGYRVFVPAPEDQDRVWVEIGFHHPLAERVVAPPSTAMLIERRGWTSIEIGPWRDLFELVSITAAESPTHHAVAGDLEPIAIPLRLVRAAREAAPSMWVLADDPIAAIERTIAALPEAVVDRLNFAITSSDSPIALLRARPSRLGPPALDTGGLELAPLAGIANLFAPPDVRVEPPLGRERLRRLLAPDPDRIYWLTPSPDPRRFAIDSASSDAFVPLPDWVEYVIDAEAAELETWVRSTRFELSPIDVIEPDPPARSRTWTTFQRQRERRAGAEAPRASEPIAVYTEAAIADPSDSARALADAERRFLESDEPLDGPGRAPLWLEIGRLAAAAGKPRTACGCFARALWEPGADFEIAGLWARAMPAPALVAAPDPAQVAAVIATVVAGLAGDALAPAVVSPWLDAHDHELDVRSIWLARLALARAVGGDRIGLARARDRLLRRIAGGLSLARDIPPFLRFAGGGADTAVAETLAARLEALLARYRETSRARSANEAPESKTAALVELEIAFGLASLGRLDRARELRARAVPGPGVDPIESYLAAAYSARIDQALEGRIGEPLPAAITAMLDELDTFERYKVDRLRQASGVLEPSARLDPMRSFSRRTSEMYGEAIARVRALPPEEIGPAIEALLDGEPGEQTLAGILDLLPRLAIAVALPLLEATITAIGQRFGSEAAAGARLLTRALEVAGLFGRHRTAARLLESIRESLDALSDDGAAELAGDVAGELARSLRPLRRAGLNDSGLTIFDDLDRRVTGWRGRGHVAAGLAFLGQHDRAAEIRRRDLAELDDPALSPAERLGRIRALAAACSAAERDLAVGELEQLEAQLPRITDSYNTNSHFCLSVVSFIDALVLGLASRDLIIGELGRRFRDADEHLVRRRIHRDMETA